jgi:cysteinyl-tRNA synthetase
MSESEVWRTATDQRAHRLIDRIREIVTLRDEARQARNWQWADDLTQRLATAQAELQAHRSVFGTRV